MHELRLGYTMQDYITGQEIEVTTYEDIRQDMARFLVEEKGVPKEAIASKVQVTVHIDGRPYVQLVDLVIGHQGQSPLIALMFCAGQVETYTRQILAAARLLPYGPASLAAVTDTRKALFLQVENGKVVQECAYTDFPNWEDMQSMVADIPAYVVTSDKKSKEARLLYALSELSCSCSQDSCSVSGAGQAQ